MWWSKRGDDSYSSLTREFDLSGLDSATLEFSTWYEIELNWDYAFVTVSTDNGETWNPLQGSLTTEDDPQGNNLGNGITGVSGSPGVETDEGTHGVWLEESMDLTPYAGQKIQLRFWMVHDAAYNAQGILIDNIRIPELNYQDGAEDPNPEGWVAEGFVRTSGSLPQLWELRLITQEGRTTKVVPIEVDAQGRASFTLEGRTNAILMISGATPFTTSPAIYNYTFK
jgi:immune inhibitor A